MPKLKIFYLDTDTPLGTCSQERNRGCWDGIWYPLLIPYDSRIPPEVRRADTQVRAKLERLSEEWADGSHDAVVYIRRTDDVLRARWIDKGQWEILVAL